jgi:UDP-N-acetylmuramoylalanine--D-glutamate ligase
MDIDINGLKDRDVLVVGLARSGTGAANLLASFGAQVTVTDTKPRHLLEENLKMLAPSVKTITGGNPEEAFISSDLIVVSPGVPLNTSSLVSAKKKGIPVIGELELAYQVVKKSEVRSQKPEEKGPLTPNSKLLTPGFIGVTGTNGKSTVTTLIDLMLKESGFRTMLGGNIGNALTEELYKMRVDGSQLTDIDFIVAEISSFQLESIQEFRPGVAVILNITPDHLDRYETVKDYIDAKARIFENQGEGDYLIVNADDPVVKKVESEKLKVKSESPKALYFSSEKEVEGLYLKDSGIYCNLPDSSHVTCHLLLIGVDEIRIKGAHNIENAMAASLSALVIGCSLEAVRNVLIRFPGLEHRSEAVRILDGVTYINDSKGTNAGAVLKALESFDEIILIMGGLDKGGDFTVLKGLVKEKVKLLILLGEAKGKIAEDIGDVSEIEFVSDMESAVELAASKASGGDTVLLSPGCASFDMFKDFEERGRRFKQAVNAL